MAEGVDKVGEWSDYLVQKKPTYAIKHGALNISSQASNATNPGPGSMTLPYNAQSYQTLVDREIMWISQYDSSFAISFLTSISPAGFSNTVNSGATLTATLLVPVAEPGVDFAPCAYPLHTLTTTMELIINSLSLTMNTSQILPTLKRLADGRKSRLGARGPTKLGVYAFAGMARGTVSSPYGCNDGARYGEEPGNGAWPFTYRVPPNAVLACSGLTGTNATAVTLISATIPGVGVIGFSGANLTYLAPGTLLTPATNGFYIDPTGIWTQGTGASSGVITPCVNTASGIAGQLIVVYNGVPYWTQGLATWAGAVGAAANVAQSSAGLISLSVGLSYKFEEPILMSPLTFGGPASIGASTMFGLQQLTLNVQLGNPQTQRLWRALDANRLISNAQNWPTSPFTNPHLRINWYNPTLSTHMPPRSIVPFNEFQCVQFNNQGTSTLAYASTGQIIGAVTQLAQVPEACLIRVSPLAPTGTITVGNDPAAMWWDDLCMPITNAFFTFDGGQNLLASFSQSRLWHMSFSNGIRMPYLQWSSGVTAASVASGGAFTAQAYGAWTTAGTQPPSTPVGTPATYVPQSASSPGIAPMSGGELFLTFGGDIAIWEALAPGCASTLQFVVTVTAQNQLNMPVQASLSIITLNSGFYTTVGGLAAKSTTILTQPEVLEDAQESGATEGEYGTSTMDAKQMIGGAWYDRLSNAYTRGRRIYDEGRRLYDTHKETIGNAVDAGRNIASSLSAAATANPGTAQPSGGGLAKRFRS